MMKLRERIATWPHPVLVLAFVGSVAANSYNVDLENTGVCTMSEAVTVTSNDIYNIYAAPPQDGRGTRDRCTVKFIGENGQKFKLYIRDLQFGECQIYLKMYDDDMFLNQARYAFDCNNAAGGYFESYSPNVAISLEKSDSVSTAYKFYVRLALVSGPDIGGETGGEDLAPTGTLTAGVLAGIIVAAVLLMVVIVAVGVYCFIVYRRKKEEKELAMAHSMTHSMSHTNLTTTATSYKDGTDSVHSSKHSTHSTHVTSRSNPAFQYPAHRSTLTSVPGVKAECNSIDTRSFDSDNDAVKGKNVKHEFDSMKRSLRDIDNRKRREAENERRHEMGREEARRYDYESRNEPQRGLGRSGRRRNDQPALNADNIKASLRDARNRGKSFDDRDGRGTRSRSGSTRSTRARHKSRTNESSSDYHSDRYDHHDNRDRSRSKTTDSSGRNTHRSASAGSMSRRSRAHNYDEREAYSEEDFDRRDNRRRHRDRADSSGHRGDPGSQRSRGHRARSSSTDSRRRAR